MRTIADEDSLALDRIGVGRSLKAFDEETEFFSPGDAADVEDDRFGVGRVGFDTKVGWQAVGGARG